MLSGKGGTGKASVVGCFAALARSKVLADCDVDATDLHLLLSPVMQQQNEFWSGQISFIDEEKCTHCNLCQKLCRFETIKDFKLVALVRQQAGLLAKEQGFDYIISDGPPGSQCPVISSLCGASLALLVTEPTLSGIHDLERVLGVCHHFGVPALVQGLPVVEYSQGKVTLDA